MKYVTYVPVAALAAATIAIASAACIDAHAAEREESMALRTVMEKLEQDMQATVGAISREDWVLIAELSPMIGRHEEPPAMEKIRILKWVGTDAGRFRAFDADVERAANSMSAAAQQEDGAGVIRSFSEIQQACLGCHQQFRKPFVEHFYGRR